MNNFQYLSVVQKAIKCLLMHLFLMHFLLQPPKDFYDSFGIIILGKFSKNLVFRLLSLDFGRSPALQSFYC